MKDRFTRGFIAAIIAGVPTAIYNWLAYYLHIANLRYSDFASVLIYGHKPNSVGETVFAIISTFIFVGLLGSIFGLVVPIIKSDNIVFKGWAYGTGLWFSFYALTYLFKVPELLTIPLWTAASNVVGAGIWGLLFGYTVNWLEKKRVGP